MSAEREDNYLLWLFRGLTEGDEDAWNEYIKVHLPVLKREARQELNRRNMRHGDSAAVCQSAFRRLLEKIRDEKVVLSNPLELMELLTTMVRNKVADEFRFERAKKRNILRLALLPVEKLAGVLVSREPDPAEQVANKELYESLLSDLNPCDAQALRDYFSGESWDSIAARNGVSANTQRMRVMRQLERFRRAMKIDD